MGIIMTQSQKTWARARDRLAGAVALKGYPKEFADLLANQLKSPGAIDRMTSYLYQASPDSIEMIVDEMLAICDEIDSWRKKKESREAQAGYNDWLGGETRRQNE